MDAQNEAVLEEEREEEQNSNGSTEQMNNRTQTCEEDEEQRRSWLRWRPTSRIMLKECEASILSHLAMPYEGYYVNIGPVVGTKDCSIWTVCFNPESKNMPLVLVHGMGAGIALWILNFKELAKDRPVYAFDVLGFGRSSRPSLNDKDPKKAEDELISSIEAWRKELNLEKMILLGHSLGGYLVSSYSLKYPERVCHLILADPWGFKDKPQDLREIARIPSSIRFLVRLFEPLNPLWAIRVTGPLGPKIIQSIRSDLAKKYENILKEDAKKISMYLYHSNAQYPSGEGAFHAMMSTFGWAKHPMHLRIAGLDNSVPITLLYGGHSWVDHFSTDKIKEMRPSAKVSAHVIEGAGHHIYADKSEEFNGFVTKIGAEIDSANNNNG